MDENLDALFDTIRQEGVEKAKKEANEITHRAYEEAEKIIADAKNRAEEIHQKTEDECRSLKQALYDELELSARDLILSVEQKVMQIFRNIFEEKITSSLSREPTVFLQTILEKWQYSEQGWRILLSEDELKFFTEDLLDSLRKKIKGGLEVQPDPEIKAGFKIMIEDGNYYLDFTEGTITDLYMEQLSPVLRDILKKTTGK